MGLNEDKLEIARNALMNLSDDEFGELSGMKMTMPWQMDEASSGSDNNDADFKGSGGKNVSRENLQIACWNKFNENPQVSTAVKGQVGRLTGFGFEVACDLHDIQEMLEEIELDPRNRLYTFWPKFVARSTIEGELLLSLTVHTDGFVEVDFIDPSNVTGGGEDGVIYHPTKPTMPLFYYVTLDNNGTATTKTKVLIPSIFIARYPELIKEAQKVPGFSDDLASTSKSPNKKFKAFGGYRRFIVSWDKGFITKRNVSYLRTILEWLNHYENLKKYEIDHKKSAGSYLWVVTMDDAKAFRSWIALSDSERAKTGIMAKKTPGGTLIMPPGMSIECKNPTLPSISESDTDIFHMITSGLNEPEDITSGQSKGSFSSVKATRGPMADRTADEVAAFEKFLRHDFYGGVFFLKSKVGACQPLYSQREAVDFNKQEPVFKLVKRRPELLLTITFPTSQTNDAEATARAFLGVKHGSTFETLGIPNEEISKKMGFGNYKRLRLRHATEIDKYPELALSVDQETVSGSADSKDNPTDSKNPDAKPVKKPTLKRRVPVKE